RDAPHRRAGRVRIHNSIDGRGIASHVLLEIEECGGIAARIRRFGTGWRDGDIFAARGPPAASKEECGGGREDAEKAGQGGGRRDSAGGESDRQARGSLAEAPQGARGGRGDGGEGPHRERSSWASVPRNAF